MGESPCCNIALQGFESRGTEISARLTTWDNLLDSISHVGPLTTNPIQPVTQANTNRRWGHTRALQAPDLALGMSLPPGTTLTLGKRDNNQTIGSRTMEQNRKYLLYMYAWCLCVEHGQIYTQII